MPIVNRGLPSWLNSPNTEIAAGSGTAGKTGAAVVCPNAATANRAGTKRFFMLNSQNMFPVDARRRRLSRREQRRNCREIIHGDAPDGNNQSNFCVTPGHWRSHRAIHPVFSEQSTSVSVAHDTVSIKPFGAVSPAG